MFTVFHAIILGVVEGITEFLPISSTGHLMLTSYLLNLPVDVSGRLAGFVTSFEIAIQLGAIAAVVGIYGKRIFTDRELDKRVLVGFVPTAVIGFVLYKFIKEFLLTNVWIVIPTLLAGGVAIIALEYYFKKRKLGLHEADITYRDAFIIGIVQSLAVVPGVSRSAATVLAGMVLGYSREKIVEFSFLLAIPTMAAATGYDLLKTGFAFSGREYGLLAVGFVVSFITAWVVVKWLLRFVRNHTFIGFGIYRILAAIVFAFIVLK